MFVYYNGEVQKDKYMYICIRLYVVVLDWRQICCCNVLVFKRQDFYS